MFQSARPRGARLTGWALAHGLADRFNPRAREGRDNSRIFEAISAVVFQSARPRGARRQTPAQGRVLHVVSIRAPARGATLADLLLQDGIHVSIRAPARGATSSFYPSRFGGLVSIRAPARGATADRFGDGCSTGVSIRAPARGATFPRALSRSTRKGFNPRAREGRDFDCRCVRDDRSVSIRAPARGATGRHFYCQQTDCLFQSARPRGARRHDAGQAVRLAGFNPRAREGRDPDGRPQRTGGGSFNPRAREGRDLTGQLPNVMMQVSIRAPARGATLLDFEPGDVGMFQSARPRGARLSASNSD